MPQVRILPGAPISLENSRASPGSPPIRISDKSDKSERPANKVISPADSGHISLNKEALRCAVRWHAVPVATALRELRRALRLTQVEFATQLRVPFHSFR